MEKPISYRLAARILAQAYLEAFNSGHIQNKDDLKATEFFARTASDVLESFDKERLAKSTGESK